LFDGRRLLDISPGTSTDNAKLGRLTGASVPSARWFLSLTDAPHKITAWREY
jgi:hypothetical protein